MKIIYNVEQNKKGKHISEAFKILKSVGEVEKKI